ncbi:MAG: cisplatin damage response ATP-dependent DNA ligase [Alphaproteobacteria bacterium]|nr:cisplatin damage response ATP-dependent DNA ligase [Alphaproteobacteria bacterium]
MKRFADLMERLVYTGGRNAKLAILAEYFRTTPDPDRGWALAALTDGYETRLLTPAAVRKLAEARTDPVLFRLSYDYVGDLAETTALIWPDTDEGPVDPPPLSEVIDTLAGTSRARAPQHVADWLDRLDGSGRYALLKLLMGGLRVGVSARLAKTALAQYGGKPVEEIEELWFGLTPPYGDLFAWLDGRTAAPQVDTSTLFRPVMLANPLEDGDLDRLAPAEYRAEWKWDGIRVQLAAKHGEARLFTRTGDEIGPAFPDIATRADFDAVLDGELLVRRDGEIRPFNDLQQRLGRKTVTAAMLRDYPAHLRVYDILFHGDRDLRPDPFDTRRAELEAFVTGLNRDWLDLSPLVPFDDWGVLRAIWDGTREAGIEGLMLKRADAPYTAGRPKGPWFKWKRAPLTADCVLMYAQRGHGKRSSLYSDFTFGCWRDGADGAPELVPVGKAYSGYTDAELREIDRWIRRNTVEKFGPVRSVTPEIVMEVAFDSVHPSKRHKSGIAMRFPRIHRLRTDKPAVEADRVETLAAMIEG